jgi:hypothetical protein
MASLTATQLPLPVVVSGERDAAVRDLCRRWRVGTGFTVRVAGREGAAPPLQMIRPWQP